MSALLATLLLFIGLLIIIRFFFFRGAESSQSEAEAKIKEMIEKSNIDQDVEVKKEEKEKGSPIVDRLAWSLKNSSSFQNEEGKSLMSKLDIALVRAGMRNKYSPEQALATAILIWLAGFGIAVFAILAGLPKLLAAGILIAMVIYPPYKLKESIGNRQDKIASEIPFFIQQLYMAISSGNTNIDGAIKKVAENNERDNFDSILSREFNQAQIEYSLGAKTTEQALRDIGYRTGVISVENLCEALIQGLRTGVPIQETLREYSGQAQEMWRQDIRNFKNKKEPLVTVGVVISMFGAFIIMISPILIGLFQTLGG